ncbi:MAG TPA: hypothetical protein PLY73_16705, partial [Candidatus Ozemobacteraceae bacterium]|nr:hypothetical protein [Candidatus Ozemobacteraceae bacterium]
MTGFVAIDRPKFPGRVVERLEGHITWDRGAWSLRNPVLRLPGGQIAFEGIVSDGHIEGELAGRDVPAEFLGIDADVVK